MKIKIILHKSLKQKCYGIFKSRFWTCQLTIVLVYGLWNYWNIYNMLYRELEYDELSFKNTSLKILTSYDL
jgi:hypothetical protein